jgi:hypothetical protein
MVILFFFLSTCLPVDTCPSIKHYVSLSIQFDRDTINMGDSLILNIEFRNKTTKDIEFYPECFQFLTQPSVVFGRDKSLVINEVSDLTKLISLPPNGIYAQKVILKSDNTFLDFGINSICLYYRCPTLKGKTDKKYNKLCGLLKSNVVDLYVYTFVNQSAPKRGRSSAICNAVRNTGNLQLLH